MSVWWVDGGGLDGMEDGCEGECDGGREYDQVCSLGRERCCVFFNNSPFKRVKACAGQITSQKLNLDRKSIISKNGGTRFTIFEFCSTAVARLHTTPTNPYINRKVYVLSLIF